MSGTRAVFLNALEHRGYKEAAISTTPGPDALREALRAVLADFDRDSPEDYLDEAVRIFRAVLPTTPAPDYDRLREAVVVEMENEGVVTWGDERHRARFLAIERAPHE